MICGWFVVVSQVLFLYTTVTDRMSHDIQRNIWIDYFICTNSNISWKLMTFLVRFHCRISSRLSFVVVQRWNILITCHQIRIILIHSAHQFRSIFKFVEWKIRPIFTSKSKRMTVENFIGSWSQRRKHTLNWKSIGRKLWALL